MQASSDQKQQDQVQQLTHEQKKLSKRINFKSDELKRFYYDLVGLETLPLEKIQEIQDLAKDMHADINTHYYHSREGEMENYMKRFANYLRLIEKLGITQNRDHPYHKVLQLHRFNLDYGLLYLHFYAFLPAIELLGSEAQQAKWVPLTKALKITGSYVQTELGHGSDVQGLQTTATYDVNTKEFIFNSPTLEATKFWPGGLGKTSNHIVLYARLISQGKDHGVQAFIVQIRDLVTHQPLEGIEVGDCGNKIALVANDNGYLRFKNFRQPKDSLLSKYVQLSDDGTFTQSKNSTRLAYGGMLKLRTNIVGSGHYYLAKQATIAARYSFRRRQFESKEGSKAPEALVIQYQMQQYKTMPAIAASWAILFVSDALFGQYYEYEAKLKANDKTAFDLLSHTHALVSGFKGVSTWYGEHFGEILKQACGGHGYLQVSGLTRPHVDFGIGVVTAEGDNTVLMQQTAMHLLKLMQQGKIDTENYEFDIKKELSIEQQFVLLYELRYKNELKYAALKVQSLMAQGSDFKTSIWNDQCQVQLFNASRYYITYFAVKNFYELLQGKNLSNCKRNIKQLSPEIQHIMQIMFRVYSMYHFIEEYESFYQNLPTVEFVNFFNVKHFDDVFKKTFKEDLNLMAMSSMDIVDGWDFKDEELLTVLGKKSQKDDSQIYQELLDVVRKNPLNKHPVPKGFNEHIRPLFVGKL